MNMNIITRRSKDMNKELQDYKNDYRDMLRVNSYLSNKNDSLLKEIEKLQHKINVLESHRNENNEEFRSKNLRCFSVYLELGYTSFVYVDDEGQDISSMHDEAIDIAKKELSEIISKNGVDFFTTDADVHEILED